MHQETMQQKISVIQVIRLRNLTSAPNRFNIVQNELNEQYSVNIYFHTFLQDYGGYNITGGGSYEE